MGHVVRIECNLVGIPYGIYKQPQVFVHQTGTLHIKHIVPSNSSCMIHRY